MTLEETTLVSAITAPIDRSMPPTTSTNICPDAAMMRKAELRNTLTMFCVARKCGCVSASTMTRAPNNSGSTPASRNSSMRNREGAPCSGGMFGTGEEMAEHALLVDLGAVQLRHDARAVHDVKPPRHVHHFAQFGGDE